MKHLTSHVQVHDIAKLESIIARAPYLSASNKENFIRVNYNIIISTSIIENRKENFRNLRHVLGDLQPKK